MSSIHHFRTGPVIQTHEKGHIGQALFAITNDSDADTLEVLSINATMLTLSVMSYLTASAFNLGANCPGNLAIRRITSSAHVGGTEIAAVKHDTTSTLASGIKLLTMGEHCDYGEYIRRIVPRVGLMSPWAATTPSSANQDLSGQMHTSHSGDFDHNAILFSFDATVNGTVPITLREGEGLSIVPDDHMEPGYWFASVTIRQRTAGGTFTYNSSVTTHGHQLPILTIVNDSNEVSPEIVEVIKISLTPWATQFNTIGGSHGQPSLGVLFVHGVEEGTVLTAAKFDTAAALPATVVARKEAIPVYPGSMSPSRHAAIQGGTSFANSGFSQSAFMLMVSPLLFSKPIVVGHPYATREAPNQRVYDPLWRGTPLGPKLLVQPGMTLAVVGPIAVNVNNGSYFHLGWPQPRCNVDVEVVVKHTAYVAPPSGGATDYAFVG